MSAQGISSGSSSEACYLLVDNGSLRPRATLWLRCLAEALSLRTGERVEPVSLLHSHKVDAAELGGRRAEIFEPAVRKRAGAGQRVFVVVPLFFGPSEALNDYLPKRIAQLKEAFEGLQVAVAPPLVRPGMPGDDRVARCLADFVTQTIGRNGLECPAVAMVDHGSPQVEVARVRNHVAAQLGTVLGDSVRAVRACSMERREGEEYAFNEPLLEGLLREPGFNEADVVLAHLFFLPGRHAGQGGDIAGICQAAEVEADAAGRELRVWRTPLVGEHPGIFDILAARLEEAREQLRADLPGPVRVWAQC